MKVDIWSDVVCPWCYIGKRRLQKAITLVEDGLNAEIRWLPFQLNPNMPAETRARIRISLPIVPPPFAGNTQAQPKQRMGSPAPTP